ncbi:MAG TPA: hypothetical protein VLQ80_29290 [Candidatus Saccharimonadia bacterium]|nr:hypothetical protein [Candidatus Saccharimonadia bacterium]
MPAKKTIFPQISVEANDLLTRICEAQGCPPGVVVEAALMALLSPHEITTRDAVLIQGQVQLHDDLVAMLGFHKQMLALLEAQVVPPVPIADFADLYPEPEGTMEPEADDLIARVPSEGHVVRARGWRTLWSRRKTV